MRVRPGACEVRIFGHEAEVGVVVVVDEVQLHRLS